MTNIPFVILNGGDFHHMMEWGHPMMNWWGIPNFGYWNIGLLIMQLIVAFLVLNDAEKRNMNGLLWFILIILPWIGILFIIGYLVIRSEDEEIKDSIDNALTILNERYAKNEITRKEYLQIKKDLKDMVRRYESKY